MKTGDRVPLAPAPALSNPREKAAATIALVSIPRSTLERLGLAVDGRAAEIAAAILSSGFLLARERNRDFAVNRHSAHTSPAKPSGYETVTIIAIISTIWRRTNHWRRNFLLILSDGVLHL